MNYISDTHPYGHDPQTRTVSTVTHVCPIVDSGAMAPNQLTQGFLVIDSELHDEKEEFQKDPIELREL